MYIAIWAVLGGKADYIQLYKATYWGIFCGEKHIPDIKAIVNCVQQPRNMVV